MKRTFTPLAILLLFLSTLVPGKSQDIHFSQFYHAFPIVNPALTGIFNGDMRFSGNYRSQWSAVPVDYQTFNLFFDIKALSKRIDSRNFAGFGIMLDYDRAGDSQLSLASLGLNGSYTLGLTERMLLTGGVSLVGSQRRYDFNELEFISTTNSQGQQVVEAPTFNEDFNRTSFFFFDINAGLNLRLQRSWRTKIDLGVAAYHLNTPEQRFDEDDNIKVDRRFAVTALGSLKLTEKFDLKLHGLGQFQGKYDELVGQLMGKLYLNQEFAKELALSLGIAYRFANNNFGNSRGDAFYPALQLDYRTLTVGLSYDINAFDFNIATDNRGGPEISVIYIIRKVKPLNQFKNCPIY